MPSFHDLLEISDRVEDCVESFETRGALSVRLQGCCFGGPGRRLYEARYPDGLAFNLLQNPNQRSNKAYDVMFTLTTGCSRVWLCKKRRYLSGIEAMLLHSIPITEQAATVMRAKQVAIQSQGNQFHCFLAGNSMHGASVGLFLGLALFCTAPSES